MADSGPGSIPGSSAEAVPPSPALPASGALTAVLTGRTTIAPGIVNLTFAMRSPPRLDFRAGQFVSITVGAPAAGGLVPRRSYSIASADDAGEHLRFIIRVIPGGVASDHLMALPIGGEVRMTGPHGFFVLDPEHAGDIVFGATGTGASAVMPMLVRLAKDKAALARGGRRLLYWGARHQEDLFARDEIQTLCREAECALRLFLTRPGSAWSGETGRITPAVLADLPGMTAPTFYLVGNGAMIAELKRELISRGVNRKKQIRTEAFFD